MSQVRLLVARHGVDLLVVAAAVFAAWSTATRDDLASEGWPRVVALSVVAAGLLLALLARHRLPFLAPAALWVGSGAMSFADGRLVTSHPALYAAGMGSAVMLGALRSERESRIGLVIVLVGAAAVVQNDPQHFRADLVFTPGIFGLCWLVGYALRERSQRTELAEERAARAEAEREAAARVAVAEERSRIARELHDVVAHAMSVVVLQVGAVRHRMPPGDGADRRALEEVERVGRSALAEMRQLLGALRRDDEDAERVPHPGLDQLPSLVEHVRSAGLPVELQVQGTARALPPALSLSAYRIVQEGLTNTLRHSGATRASVVIRYGDQDLCIEVHDDGRGGAGVSANGARAPGLAVRGPGHGPGHGLVGVAERVKIYGGDMRAGSSAEGGFVMRVRLPVDTPPS